MPLLACIIGMELFKLFTFLAKFDSLNMPSLIGYGNWVQIYTGDDAVFQAVNTFHEIISNQYSLASFQYPFIDSCYKTTYSMLI